MSQKHHLKLQSVLLACVLLYPAIAYGQAGDAEMEAFREELDARDDADLSLEQYQKTLSKFLEHRSRFSLERWLSQLFRFAGDGDVGDLRILNATLLGVGILALIAVVGFFAQQIRHHLISDAPEETPQSSEDVPFTARAALDQAEQFEVHHNFREALRSLYLAALLHLQERGLVSYDKSLTNREHLRELKAHPNLQNVLRPVVHTFDDVWYGHKPCNAGTMTEYRGFLQKVYEACH